MTTETILTPKVTPTPTPMVSWSEMSAVQQKESKLDNRDKFGCALENEPGALCDLVCEWWEREKPSNLVNLIHGALIALIPHNYEASMDLTFLRDMLTRQWKIYEDKE